MHGWYWYQERDGNTPQAIAAFCPNTGAWLTEEPRSWPLMAPCRSLALHGVPCRPKIDVSGSPLGRCQSGLQESIDEQGIHHGSKSCVSKIRIGCNVHTLHYEDLEDSQSFLRSRTIDSSPQVCPLHDNLTGSNGPGMCGYLRSGRQGRQ